RRVGDVQQPRDQQPEVQPLEALLRGGIRGGDHRRGREHAALDRVGGGEPMIGSLGAGSPPGPIGEEGDQHPLDVKLVNPANKRRYEIIVVGSGLAGASAAASLGELGYHVTLFTFHDSPRRAHSIAAQGGINAAKNYRNDGDSVFRLFYDTVKGG